MKIGLLTALPGIKTPTSCCALGRAVLMVEEDLGVLLLGFSALPAP